MNPYYINRRQFLAAAAVGAASLLVPDPLARAMRRVRRPNLLFILVDQWRAQATGYAGNTQVKTAHIDALAAQSVNFSTAVSGCPVCCPYRASLITGRYPLTDGVFLNDVRLNTEAVPFARVFDDAGYETGYIGKWHLDGDNRSAFIPAERRQGFEFWRAFGCTHNYNNSFYWTEQPVKHKWPGYDAIAQTEEACNYISRHTADPFVLVLSVGPPHAPYNTAPQKYRDMFDPKDIKLRPNVPPKYADAARRDIAGYYAHMAALDDCVGRLLETLDKLKIADNTIVVFTADHGDMLYSQGGQKKQQPWDESIRVPFLLRWPGRLGPRGRTIDMPINTPDIMPTLLGLAALPIPQTVEGRDFSAVITGDKAPDNEAALISCPSPFGQWDRARGGREYRGVRTRRYTYVRDLKGPWLLYDNKTDPYQMDNLVNKPEHKALQDRLEAILRAKLERTHDEFLPGPDYIKKWGIHVNASGTVPYKN